MPPRERLGKYEILEVLGRGAMGVVFKGFDPGIDRTVAIKTVRKELIEDDDRAGMALARFRNEARAAGRLAHPGIVAVYDYGESESVTYIAMEYVQGNSLREYFNRGARFREADVVSIMSQLLEALQHAHDAGVWHRDIKPANLIIMGNGRLKIADFGIARIEASQLTQTGVVMGSPGYMAPEQYAGGTIDWRADLFASAVVMHQLLTGVRLYTGTAEQVAYKICHQEAPPPSMVDPGKGWERYDLLLQRALTKNPEHRFPSAVAFREAILQVYAAPVSASVSEETIIAGTMSPAAVFEPSNPSARTGDGSVSSPSRTPTPPPIAPVAIESAPEAPAAPSEAPPAVSIPSPAPSASMPARRWPLLAGVSVAVVVGAVLGGWWVGRSTRPPTPVVAAVPPTPASAAPAPLAKSPDANAAKHSPKHDDKKSERNTSSPAPVKKEQPAAAPMPEPKPAPPAKAERPAALPAPKVAETSPPPKRKSEAQSSKVVAEATASAAPAKKSESAASATPRPRESQAQATKQSAVPPTAERAPVKPSPQVTPAVVTARKPPTSTSSAAAASPLGAPPPIAAPALAPTPAPAPVVDTPTEVASAAPVAEAATPAEPPESAKPPPPPPSIWRDQGITMKVASKIQFNRRLWTSNIKVETSKGIVYLRGSVSSKELYDEAEKIAAAEYGVHGVKNELTIRH